MNASAVTFEVANRFAGLHRRYLAARVAGCLAAGTMLLMFGWFVLALLDYRFEWSQTIRSRAAWSMAAVVAAAVLAGLVHVIRGSSRSRFVGILEFHFAALGQRLRTVLQAADGRLSAPSAMLAALGHQTLGRWETVAPGQVVPSRAAFAGCALAAAATFGLAGGIGFDNDWRTALLRAIGSDLPYTTLRVTPGDDRVLEGTPVTVRLELSGRVDRQVLIRYREADSDTWIESEPAASTGSADSNARDAANLATRRRATFVAALGAMRKPVEYQFLTDAGSSPLYRIDVQPRIEVIRTDTQVTPPEYTRLSPRTFSRSDVSVLSGSQVTVTVQTNHPLENVEATAGEKPNRLEPIDTQSDESSSRWTFRLPSDTSLHWTFSGAGSDGTPMTPIRGRMRVHHDAPPKIQWLEPHDELTVHMLAEVPLEVSVSDDYGLIDAGIVFQIGDEEELVLSRWQADTESPADSSGDDLSPATSRMPEVTTRTRLREILPLESFRLTERDYVAYYAYAVDNRAFTDENGETVPAGRRTESDVRYIDIRPLRQFFSERDFEPQGGGGGGLRVPLSELIRRQRFLINRTRKWVRVPGAAASPDLAMVERMVAAQSELADLTRFLAERLVSMGNDDVEALNQAESAMLNAADALSIADFDLAMVHEEAALRSLVEARQMLDLVLQRNRTPQQSAQLRQLRQQLMQRLRRSRPATDAELADTLRRLAAEQRQIAGEAASAVTSATDSELRSNGAGSEEPADESSNANAQSNAEADENAAEDTEQQAPLWVRQQDLRDRFLEVGEGLSDRVKRSAAVTRRFREAQGEMDTIAEALRDGQAAEVVPLGRDVADRISELALHVEALSPPEPAKRIASLRDLTSSLANIERQLSLPRDSQKTSPAGAAGQAAEDADNEASDDPADVSPPQDAEGGSAAEVDEGAGQAEGRSAADADDAAQQAEGAGATEADEAARQAKARTPTAADELERLASRAGTRAETLADVLDALPLTADLQETEIVEALTRLAEETDFRSDLEETLAATEDLDELRSDEGRQAAQRRARDYADRALQLDQLYRQAVTPRLDQLRRLENQAARITRGTGPRRDGESQGGSIQPKPQGEDEDPPTSESERFSGRQLEAEIRELERGLRAADLDELADALNAPAPDAEAPTTEFFQPGMKSEQRDRFSPNRMVAPWGQVVWVQKELRERIQEMILLEISADRNAPVPPRYRELVDGYFRTLAGEAD